MSQGNHPTFEPPLFSAIITPHRSLSRSGFVIVMAVIAGLSLATGVAFLMMGAWPVLGFLGLQTALIYWAFHVNFRAAAAFEEVTVTPSELVVRNTNPLGQVVSTWTANPLWTRLDRETHEDFGLLQLFIVSGGRRQAVARHLAPHERESFASALAAAIGEARRGPDLSR